MNYITCNYGRGFATYICHRLPNKRPIYSKQTNDRQYKYIKKQMTDSTGHIAIYVRNPSSLK